MRRQVPDLGVDTSHTVFFLRVDDCESQVQTHGQWVGIGLRQARRIAHQLLRKAHCARLTLRMVQSRWPEPSTNLRILTVVQ